MYNKQLGGGCVAAAVLACVTCYLSSCATTAPTYVAPSHTTALSSPAPVDAARYAIPNRPNRIGRIVAPVRINGQGPYYFMVDTGANRTVITAKLAEQLGLDIENAPTATVQGVAGSIVAPVVTLDLLQSGELTIHGLRAPVLTGPVLAQIDGILGMDGLANKKITADFIKDRIRISDSRGEPAELRFAVIHFEVISRRLIMVDARIGRIPVKAIIDTGGTHTLGNLALLNAITAQGNADARVSESTVFDVTENLQYGRRMLAPRIRLGKAVIANIAVTFGDFRVFHIWRLDEKPALLIGMDVLGVLGELSIDYKRKELHVRAR
jgi:clan AA aspartic protease (TIGR02281 family)